MFGGRIGGTERAAQRCGAACDPDGSEGAEDDGEPGAVDARLEGTSGRTRADLARDHRGRSIGEENEDVRGGEQDRAEAGQGFGAEVTDDRGVGEEEERFGDEREEGWHREPEDLAALSSGAHPPIVRSRPIAANRATVASLAASPAASGVTVASRASSLH